MAMFDQLQGVSSNKNFSHEQEYDYEDSFVIIYQDVLSVPINKRKDRSSSNSNVSLFFLLTGFVD